jgi:hypothetical protein
LSFSTTAAAADPSIISYDTTETKHKFTKPNHNAAKPDDNVWIGFLTYSYHHVGAQNAANRQATLRAYMPALAGNLINQHKWANMTRIKDLITTVQQTRTIEIMTEMKIANAHQQHTNSINIKVNDLAMIVDVHHRKHIRNTVEQ